MAARKTNPFARELARVVKDAAKARPQKLHRPLFDAFVIVAASGESEAASRIVDWMYGGRVPVPDDVVTALSTLALDAFCNAAKLGDRTRGLPRHERTSPREGPLAQRVAEAEAIVRARVTGDAYSGKPPTTDAWMKKKPNDPSRQIDRWRRVQALVVQGHEESALDRLVDLLNEWPDDARGAGYGDELVLALDLALRNGRDDLVPEWLARHGHRFASEGFLLQTALCLPAVAKKIERGLLKDVIGLSKSEIASAMKALDDAIDTALSAAPKATPKVVRRRVSCEYNQVHLCPEKLDAVEKKQVHFQKKGDTERGMSLFATTVGIATPNETDYVDAEISLSAERKPKLDGAVQAVSFPIRVRGPLLLASATSGDDEAFVMPNGDYDVLARFFPKKAPKASRDAGLRVFSLLLTLHPKGALGAPRTLKIEELA